MRFIIYSQFVLRVLSYYIIYKSLYIFKLKMTTAVDQPIDLKALLENINSKLKCNHFTI